MNPQENGVCPCCGRHCPENNLHCAKGKAHFGQSDEQTENPYGHNHSHAHSHFHERHSRSGGIKDETVMLMLKCGHILHHDLREQAESGDILTFLSPTEKARLTEILKKCVNNWQSG